jgi:hypothetical protein
MFIARVVTSNATDWKCRPKKALEIIKGVSEQKATKMLTEGMKRDKAHLIAGLTI